MAAASGVQLALDNADGWWADCAIRALRWLAVTGQPFEAYDLTELGVPDPDHPNRWGAVFRNAHRAGLIEPSGFTQSRRPGRAGGLTRTWVGPAKRSANTDTAEATFAS